MADSEVRQKFEAWVAGNLEQLTDGLGSYRIRSAFEWWLTWQAAYSAGMRAGEIAQREQAVFLAAKLLPAHMAKRLIAALPLPAAPEEKIAPCQLTSPK